MQINIFRTTNDENTCTVCEEVKEDLYDVAIVGSRGEMNVLLQEIKCCEECFNIFDFSVTAVEFGKLG